MGELQPQPSLADTLTSSEERYRSLVENIKDYAVYMLDADGHIATWNRGAEKTKGYRADEVIGKHFSIFFTEEDVKNGRPWKLLEVATNEGRVEDEAWRVRKNGQRFWADAILTRVQDIEGRVI